MWHNVIYRLNNCIKVEQDKKLEPNRTYLGFSIIFSIRIFKIF